MVVLCRLCVALLTSTQTVRVEKSWSKWARTIHTETRGKQTLPSFISTCRVLVFDVFLKPLPVQPRHDPTTSGALIMPSPSHAHQATTSIPAKIPTVTTQFSIVPWSFQWEFNKLGLPVVDVVVDPRLSNWLRSHQRDGVVYLYECVMGMRPFAGQGAILAYVGRLSKTIKSLASDCLFVCQWWNGFGENPSVHHLVVVTVTYVLNSISVRFCDLLRTLIKQGSYGGRPVVKKAIIITPSSLVKVSMGQ